MNIQIPGLQTIRLDHLVLDYNGTLAEDGVLINGVTELLHQLNRHLTIHVITADTFGSVVNAMAEIPCEVKVIDPLQQDRQKGEFVKKLGAEHVLAVGNGRNDKIMLKEAVLGIAVIQKEGTYAPLISEADVVCTSITDALELLTHPKRLIATLRN
ncbi:MAG: HAD family hydrolase [Microbacter sp.]